MNQAVQPYREPEATPVGHSGIRVEIQERPAWAINGWAADEFRTLNAHVEMLLRRALTDAGRMPQQAAPVPKRGRPPTRNG